MMKTKWIRTAAALSVACACASLKPATVCASPDLNATSTAESASVDILSDQKARRPNIVIILADDLGWRDTSGYGSTYYETPRIDALQAKGMSFINGYAASPICSPTRASILTGKNPDRTGITSPWCHMPPRDPSLPRQAAPYQRMRLPLPRTYLPDAEYTLAEAMRDAGYRTALIGKWHLGSSPHDPENNGFEVNIGGMSWGGPKSYFSPYRNPKLKDGQPGEHLTDRLAKEAATYIREHKKEPFFLCFWPYAVHSPWQGKPEYIKYYKNKKDPQGLQINATMAAMIQSLDEAVGTVLDTLEETGLEKDTLVFFLGDNGAVGKHRSGRVISNNHPLRGQKAQLFEGGVRVPFMARWPGHIEPGTADRKTVVTSTDLYATVLRAAGVEPRPEQARDSANLMPLLTGTGSLEREAVFFHYPEGHTYLAPKVEGASIYAPGSSVRAGNWKLIRFYETSVRNYPNRFELYNLTEDLSESRNLADQYPEKVKALIAMLDAYFKDTKALLPQPNPAYDKRYDYLYQVPTEE